MAGGRTRVSQMGQSVCHERSCYRFAATQLKCGATIRLSKKAEELALRESFILNK